MPLIGNTWIDDNEHPTPWACMEWIRPTTGEHRFRNTSNTAYIDHGNINEQLGGAVDASGDDMTGPLLGAHGLPPLENPDFQEGAFIEGLRVATSDQIATLQRFLLARMSKEIRQMFLSLKKLESGGSNPTIVKECGFWMVADVPFVASNPLTLRDPFQVGDFFDIETTAVEILQAGYYRIEKLDYGISYSYKAGPVLDTGPAVSTATTKVDIHKNDTLLVCPDRFPNAKGRLGTCPSNINNITSDHGLFFSHYRSHAVEEYLNMDLKFEAGDRLTFRNPSMIGPYYRFEDVSSGNKGPRQYGFAFPPVAFVIRLVTLI